MPTRLLLESLPLEVLHHVLSNLNASELVPVRAASVRLRDLATSNIHWRRCLLSELIPSYAALQDVSKIPSQLWSFSLVHDGWFRAYCKLWTVAKEPWLKGDNDLVGAPWMVYFKQQLLRESDAGVEEPHAWITFTADRLAIAMSGVPLRTRRWWIDNVGENKIMLVSAYPPNIPGRELRSLCRKFEHSTVIMLSDSPEFLAALMELNTTVLEEAVRVHVIAPTELETRRNAVADAAKTLRTDYDGRYLRLWQVLGLRRASLKGGSSDDDNEVLSDESLEEYDDEEYDDGDDGYEDDDESEDGDEEGREDGGGEGDYQRKVDCGQKHQPQQQPPNNPSPTQPHIAPTPAPAPVPGRNHPC